MVVVAPIMGGHASETVNRNTVMIDVSRQTPWVRMSLRKYLEAHRTASRPAFEKERRGRLIGRTKGGMETESHAVTDANGHPIRFLMTAGQGSDYTGAAALPSNLSEAEWMLAYGGHDAGLAT